VANAFPVDAARRCIVFARPRLKLRREHSRAVALTLLVIHLGLSIADAALLFHHSEVTLRLWLSRAGQHAHQVQAHFFRNLTLGHVQLDELYTTLRNTAYDLWVWVAFDPVTKLLPALQLGPRTQDVAYALLHALSQVLAPGCPEGTHVSVNGLWGKAAWHFGAEAMIGIPGLVPAGI